MRKVLLFVCAASQPPILWPTNGRAYSSFRTQYFKGRVYLNISLQQIVQLGNYLIDISTERNTVILDIIWEIWAEENVLQSCLMDSRLQS